MHVDEQRAAAHDLDQLPGTPPAAPATARYCPPARAGAHQLPAMAPAAHETSRRGAGDEAGRGNGRGLHRGNDRPCLAGRGEAEPIGYDDDRVDFLGIADVLSGVLRLEPDRSRRGV